MEEKGDEDQPCTHMSTDDDWLPILQKDIELTLSLHPYCENCGIVRNVGPDRPKKLGYYVEKLSDLERYLDKEDSKGGKSKLTEVHKRLIVKEMEEEEVFNDLYGVLATTQERKFVKIVRKFRPDLEESLIKYYLE